MRRGSIVLLLGLVGCKGAGGEAVAAAVTAGAALAAAAVNRAATDDCLGDCAQGYRCDEYSGLCVPIAEATPARFEPYDDDDGCITEDDGTELCPDDPATEASGAEPTDAPPAPDPGPAALEVEGFGAAVAAVPEDAPERVVVAAHGNFDRPAWQCEEWRALLPDALVLCPRGVPRPDSPSEDDTRYTYEDDDALEDEVDAVLSAATDRWGSAIPRGPVLYAGFSLGAHLGVRVAARQPTRLSRLILIEGGHDAWTAARVEAFADGGGERVLFVCGSAPCRQAAASPAARLEAAGVETRVVTQPGVGHGYGGPLRPLIATELPWLLSEGAHQR